MKSAARHLPAKHLVEHDPERINVRPVIHGLAIGLLRRGVVRGAHRDLRDRHLLGPGVGQPRQSEVGHLHLAGRVDHHVAGFDVPMDDPILVRVGKRGTHLPDDGKRLVRIEAHAVDDLVEVLPLHVVHDDEEVAGGGLAEIVDGDDIRVVQPRHDPRLALEIVRKAAVPADLERQQFDRDEAVERNLPRQIDCAHAAAADELLHLVAGEKAGGLLRGRRFPRGHHRGEGRKIHRGVGGLRWLVARREMGFLGHSGP